MGTMVVECVMNISTRKTWQLELNATQITATEINPVWMHINMQLLSMLTLQP